MAESSRGPEVIADVDELRRELESIDGVMRADLDEAAGIAYLICDGGSGGGPIESAAAAMLATAGREMAVRTAFLVEPAPRRRVRLVRATLDHPDLRSATAFVTLEWGGLEFEGHAQGEGGPGGDLRTCVVATTEAVRAVVPALPEIQVVGVRSVRVFDRDLLVVLLRARVPGDRPLLGASFAEDDIASSVSRAVLHAMNRMLGNYLSVSD
jgi:hypothetical protein